MSRFLFNFLFWFGMWFVVGWSWYRYIKKTRAKLLVEIREDILDEIKEKGIHNVN